MTTMSDRLEKYRKFAVTGVIPVIATANPSKSAAFLEGAEVTPTLSPGVTGVTPSESGYRDYSWRSEICNPDQGIENRRKPPIWAPGYTGYSGYSEK
jgi:hypothetical protein